MNHTNDGIWYKDMCTFHLTTLKIYISSILPLLYTMFDYAQVR